MTKKEKDIYYSIKKDIGEYVLEYILYIDSGYDAYKSLLLLGGREDKSILGLMLKEAVNMVKSGISMQKALASIIDRYYEQNLDSFLRIILRGYVRGEDGMTGNLQILIEKILHDEVALIREKAEKASTKLSFPVALIFIAIILIAIYPAITQINI